MLLPSRLSATTLGDLLGVLHRARASGVLELCERARLGRGVPGRLHRVHLADGLVARVDTELSVTPLGELLRARGIVDRAALEELALRIARGETRAAGDLLLAIGATDERAIALGLNEQARQRLEALFTIEDATLRFNIARPVLARVRATLPPREFLHGRPRARDATKKAEPNATNATNARQEPVRKSPRARALSVLGLHDGATEVDVRRAFRRLASQEHPDGRSLSTEQIAHRVRRLAELSAAYHLLVA
jgi:DnaJ-domain-containing protein 1